MSRSIVADLRSPVPLGSLLPDVYRRHDENILTFTDALDEVIAPVWLALDCFDSYIDPLLAPMDFLGMLSSWVALPLDENWTEEQSRRLVATAVQLYRWRGTRRGLIELVKAYATVEPEVHDSGGTSWSLEPGSAAPGTADPTVRVVVDLPPRLPVDLERLTRLIAANVPAHVAVTVEVRRDGRTTQRLDVASLRASVTPLASAREAGGIAAVPRDDSPAVWDLADVAEPTGGVPSATDDPTGADPALDGGHES